MLSGVGASEALRTARASSCGTAVPVAGWHAPAVAVGRAARFEERKPRVIAVFGEDGETLRIVDRVLELMEMAWHDCYGQVTPSENVVDDVLLCSGGTLDGLITAAHLAVVDSRDLSMWASVIRRQAGGTPR
jgi:hypothetical protein